MYCVIYINSRDKWAIWKRGLSMDMAIQEATSRNYHDPGKGYFAVSLREAESFYVR